MKGVLLSGVTAALLLGGGIASAADLYRAPAAPAAVPAVPYVYAFSWTGFYIGVNVGYGCCGDDKVGISQDFDRRKFGGTLGTLEVNGVFGGAQLGYNWQWGNLVLGVEADWQGSDLNDSTKRTFAIPDLSIAGQASDTINWFGTARGRLGFAWDRVLVYGTGGFAWGNIDSYRVNIANTDDGVVIGRGRIKDSDIYTGFAAGGGVEFAWASNWTTKLEYQYINLGSKTLSGVVQRIDDDPEEGNGRFRTKATPDFHTIRLGINYKFGFEPAPPPPAAAVVKY